MTTNYSSLTVVKFNKVGSDNEKTIQSVRDMLRATRELPMSDTILGIEERLIVALNALIDADWILNRKTPARKALYKQRG